MNASILFLLFAEPFDAEQVRPVVTAALPNIASLTAGLPPPEGPGSSSSEGFGRA